MALIEMDTIEEAIAALIVIIFLTFLSHFNLFDSL